MIELFGINSTSLLNCLYLNIGSASLQLRLIALVVSFVLFSEYFITIGKSSN